MVIGKSRVVVTGARVPSRHLDAMRQCDLDVANPTEHLPGRALVSALRGAEGYLLGGDELATRDVLLQSRDLRLLETHQQDAHLDPPPR